jgi:hypothetical protein
MKAGRKVGVLVLQSVVVKVVMMVEKKVEK